MRWYTTVVALLALLPFAAGTAVGQRTLALAQAYDTALDGHSSKDTPVTRVTNLLKEMQGTLEKEMDEDADLYKELMCWCNDNGYAKDSEIKEAQAKVAELESSIEGLTAKSKELAGTLKEVNAELAADKETLATAKATREKQIKEFHAMELDSIQAIENLKAAITVLAKHQEEQAFPQLSLLSTGSKKRRWSPSRGDSELRSFDEFLMRDGFDSDVIDVKETASSGFLQQTVEAPKVTAPATNGWTTSELAVVRKALHQGTAFMQSQHGQGYFPTYEAKSGEILGVMKQMQEEMTESLKDAQKEAKEQADAFDELRSAKTAEIETGEKMSETKEDEKAETDNQLAEAKEDLKQTQDFLEKAEKMKKTLAETCGKATANFEERKSARMEEIKAVGETIEILTGDDARDAMTSTFSFVQVSSHAKRSGTALRRRASALLKRAAAKTRSPQLALLATNMELDAFNKVKKAIDDMITELKTQQADEVKKHDWCNAEFQENDMTTMKTEDKKDDLVAAIAELEQRAKTLTEEIKADKASIANAQANLQKASMDRKKENLEFQTTIADQQMTIEVLHKALDKLATFYDQALIQKSAVHRKQPSGAPAQMEYKPSSGAGGVMQMIEKLIQDCKDIQADSKKSEIDAQAAYEELIAETNENVASLQEAVVTKEKAKGKTKKQHRNRESDLQDTVKELEGLYKYKADLHKECDYLMKNFDVRQKGRGEEMEALQQAKQILSGADLS